MRPPTLPAVRSLEFVQSGFQITIDRFQRFQFFHVLLQRLYGDHQDAVQISRVDRRVVSHRPHAIVPEGGMEFLSDRAIVTELLSDRGQCSSSS